MYAVEQLKKIIDERDELKEIYLEKTQELAVLKANEPGSIPCTHYDEEGNILHPGGDPNPQHDVWRHEIELLENEINKYHDRLVECQVAVVDAYTNIKLYNEVVIKFESSPVWQSYLSSR